MTARPRDLTEQLHRLGRRWMRWSAAHVPTDGLHPARLRVLQAMVCGEPLTMGELARRTETSAANVSKLVTDMVADGLVTRSPSGLDGRVQLVSVTPAGAAAFRDAWDGYLDRVSAVFEPLPEAARVSIREALDRLLDALPDDERPG